MTENINKGSKRAYLIEAILFFTYAFFAVNWIAGSTLTPDIAAYFGVDSGASASFVSNAVTIAKIIGNFSAAAILNKLMPKKSIALGSFLIFGGSLLAVLAKSYSMFLIGRFIMGFGGAVFVIYFSPVVIHYFNPDQRPTINALNSVAYNFGAVLALLIVGPVIARLNTWQASMTFFLTISGILFVLWLIAGEDFDIDTNVGGEKQAKVSFSEAMKDKITLLMPFAYSGVLILYLSLLQLFPQTEGAAISSATLSALSGIGGIIGTLIAIWLSKVYFKRKPVIIICGIIMTLSAFLMIKTHNPTLAIIAALLVGIFMFLPMTSLMMIPQELPGMTPARLTTIMGIFWALSYIIETIVFYIFGILKDKTGTNTLGVNIAVILSLTFVVGGFLLPETGKDKSVK
jgi:predicted MFS family arabinose efflux permease